jgi:outer membrane cobalamin receptor
MGVRVCLFASVSAAAVAGCGLAHAQDNSGPDRGSAANLLPPTVVYPATPLATPGTGFAVDKVPSSVNFVGSAQIARTGSLSVTDALRQSVPGIDINEVAGNPFQPNVEFRGFVGAPVAGTPQGLAVYQNGVRINEAFGDTVNWDLIPTAAIRSAAVVANNPAFGLNALGGAVALQMKDGFGYQGAAIDTMAGSFGRIQGSAQWGRAIDRFAVYGALEGVHDDGYRNFSRSDIRRFYGDVGYQNADAEVHLNMGVADNKFGAAATVPIELLQQNWGATYTTPQTTANQVAYTNLSGKVDVTPTWTVQAIASKPSTAIRPPRSPVSPMRRCFASATAARRPTVLTATSLSIRSRPMPSSARSIAREPVRPLADCRWRRPTRTTSSDIPIASWWGRASTPASPISMAVRSSAPSVRTTS